MNLSAEEKLMYEVMRAIYESGIPVDFKGSMVLKACLAEAGYSEDTRHTIDIDANWHSETVPSPKEMTDSIQNALDRHGLNLDVVNKRAYGEGRSAGFKVYDRSTDDVLFTMDMDVNRPSLPARIYEVSGLKFSGASPAQIITDKISAISTEKVFRRIKDVVDIYYISRITDFDKESFLYALRMTRRELGDFDAFLNHEDELRHAYGKFRFAGDVSKPSFDEIYSSVKSFIHPVLPRERILEHER